jgi:hypothetical protein
MSGARAKPERNVNMPIVWDVIWLVPITSWRMNKEESGFLGELNICR